MAETRTRLVELCRDHEIGMELVEQSRDLEQILDRTLAECERRIGGGATSPEDRLRQLSGLVRLARTTRSFQTEGASLDDERRAEEALQRVDRELSEAESRSDRLQRSLEATLAQMDGNVVRPVDIEQLGELLGSVSRLCHKINNPLTSIMGRAQMLQLKVKQGQDAQLAKSIAVIEESAKRVAALVQELANLVCHARKEFVESYDSNNNSR